LAAFLRSTYDVVTFPYDWRLPLTESAGLFRDKIEELLKLNQPIKIIGHSMGGVLVRDFILLHDATWKKLNASRDFQLIFLGAPLGGSFRIPAVLFGKDAIIDKLAKVDLFHTKKQLLDIFCRFPGLLSLLPLSQSLDQDFSSDLTWNRMAEAMEDTDWPLPVEKGKGLPWFQQYRDNVLQNADNIDFTNICYIAGKDRATPCGYRIDETAQGRELVFLSTGEGDQSVTWETGIPKKLIEKDAVYYVNVTHGALASAPQIFDGIAEILATGVSRLLSKTRPVVRGEEKVFKAPDLRDFDLSEDGVEKTILGLESQEQDIIVELPLNVSVKNGDLSFASYPVLAGHFLNDGILSAEVTIDKMLDGALTERHRLGIYPGEIGTSKVHFSDGGKSAIIVGLGSFGTLTSSLLTQTVEQGVAGYLLDVNDQRSGVLLEKQAPLGISTLVIASGYGGLSIENSVSAIVQGVQNANAKVEKLHEGRYKLVEHIEFIELYEDRALSCFYTLSKMTKKGAGTPQIRLAKKEINHWLGAKKRIPTESSESWWNRITVQVDEKSLESKGRHCLRFTASTLGAREESRNLFVNPEGLENMLRTSTDGNLWSPRLGKTLFEMLLPVDFKEQFKRRFNINWVLDKYAAAYPWELLQDNVTDAKPLCVNTGMIRQLVTKDYRQKINPVAANNALVIAEPALNSYLPELPGAQKEGKIVAAALEKNGMKITALMQETSAKILPALHADEYKIIHLAGHGSFNKDEPENSGMVIGENSFLTTADIENMSTVPELVFVNCCHLGRTDPKAEEYYRNAYRLAANIGTQLIENGVKAVVVAGWAVSDDAAQRFTEIFYQNMFEGDCFGDAVHKARRAIYDEFHAVSNTWGAYQCYGDPFYKIHNEQRKADPKFEFVIAEEAEIELSNLQSEIETGKYTHAAIVKQLSAISKAVDAAQIRQAAITEKEAHIYAALFEYDKAIEKFENLLGMERADFSVSTLEKYNNVRMKKYVADYLKVSKSKKPVSKEVSGQWLQSAEKAISGLESLLLISPTAERYSLLGSAYKRKGILCTTATEKKKAYATAAYYYQKAHAIEAKLGKAYALTNWYEMENVLALAGDRDWKSKVQVNGEEYSLPSHAKVVRQLNEFIAAVNESHNHSDYWTMMTRPNYRLCLLMIDTAASGKKKWEELYDDYKNVWDSAGSKGDKYAEIEHLQILADALSMSKENNSPLKENIESLKNSLEKMLA
ncbi:MAG TPA: CHAT domain-containing protein, partial [Flavisolibacter sp.]|nr:CHAT domain-containing protein [Flavisolibacter sp.]